MDHHDSSDNVRSTTTDDTRSNAETRRPVIDRSEELERHLEELIDMATD